MNWAFPFDHANIVNEIHSFHLTLHKIFMLSPSYEIQQVMKVSILAYDTSNSSCSIITTALVKFKLGDCNAFNFVNTTKV